MTVVNTHDARGELALQLSSGAMDADLTRVIRKNKNVIRQLIQKP